MILTRRSILTGLTASFAAPAIVRASSLMPIRARIFDPFYLDSRVSRYLWDLGMRIHGAVVYGNPEWSPMRFTGLEPFFDLSVE